MYWVNFVKLLICNIMFVLIWLMPIFKIVGQSHLLMLYIVTVVIWCDL